MNYDTITRLEAIPIPSEQSDEIHRQHLEHAWRGTLLLCFCALIAACAVSALAQVIIAALPTAFLWGAFTLLGFAGLIFAIAFEGWRSGRNYLLAREREWRADAETQRELKAREMRIREQQARAHAQLERAALQPPKASAPQFGRVLGEGNKFARVETTPPADFIRWLYTKGHDEKMTVWGEERTAAQWGDESDMWLAELAKLRWIRGRDPARRKPGTLIGSADECLAYFHYSTTPE